MFAIQSLRHLLHLQRPKVRRWDAMFVTDHVKTVSPEAEERARQRELPAKGTTCRGAATAEEAAAAEAAAAAAAEQEVRRVALLADSSGKLGSKLRPKGQSTSVSDKQRLPPLPSVNGRRR